MPNSMTTAKTGIPGGEFSNTFSNNLISVNLLCNGYTANSKDDLALLDTALAAV